MIRPLFVFSLLASPLAAQGLLPFSDGKWEIRGDSATVTRVDGREALQMNTGRATRRDVRLQDGTIDLDVQLTPRRSFVYVGFRMQDDDNNEEFYIRPHKTLLPDAIQYAPVFNGQSAWQLYHGPGATAAPSVATGKWTHLRIVIAGRRAAIFLGDTLSPVLLVPRLAREPRPGYLALYALLPQGTPGSGAIATFANVAVRPGVIAYDFPALGAEAPLRSGVIREWLVGSARNVKEIAPTRIAPEWLAGATGATVEPNGMVELNRWLSMPPEDTSATDVGTVARVRVNADRAGLRRLDLGFSDAVTVFLNGQPLFHGDQSYLFQQRRDGLISFGQASVYLPLRAGSNDLAVFVTDHFGGWGLMARFADPQGLTVGLPPKER
jgi:hypothetical protein